MYDFVVNNSQMFNNETTKSEFPLYLQQEMLFHLNQLNEKLEFKPTKNWFKFNIFVIREIKNE